MTSAFVLCAILVGLKIFGSYTYFELKGFTERIFSYSSKEALTLSELVKIFADGLTVFFKSIAPVFGIALIAALILAYSQVGFLFTVETLKFKFERINPFSGIKRMFSLRSVVELLKSLFKVILLLLIVYWYLRGEAGTLLTIMNMDVFNAFLYICGTAFNVALRICIVLVILGIIDFLYQWWEFEKSLKMSKEEIKEEYKQIEGNPEIKSKIKQKQRQISMRRMLNDVPKADVVITNPTHFAVAVRYDIKIANAPIVVAKGQDYMAKRIKDVAKENGVEIVENKPLARALYNTVDIGEMIPPELYQAVAEVLAFVYSLKGKKTG